MALFVVKQTTKHRTGHQGLLFDDGTDGLEPFLLTLMPPKAVAMNVLVLGGGYAGVVVARRLERRLPSEVELTVVDESASHLVQHELHRLVRFPDMVGAITVPFEDLFNRAHFVRARVTEIDGTAGLATLHDGREIPFDYAAVCLGARTDYHGLPGVEEHSTPLKRVADAETIRQDVLALTDGGEGRVVVGGAGLSGIQIAGELAAITEDRGVHGSIEVVLLEQAGRVAPGFPTHFSEAVDTALIEAGVDVRTAATVTGATANVVVLEEGEVPFDQLVWTGGIHGPAPLGDERPTVPATLRLSDRTFVLGDAASVVDQEGEVVPATAQAALAEARVAARNIARLVRHALEDGVFEPRLERVDFEPTGWVVSVGRRTVAQIGPLVFRDRAALALKTAAGARYLTGVGALREAAGLVGDELLAPRSPG